MSDTNVVQREAEDEFFCKNGNLALGINQDQRTKTSGVSSTSGRGLTKARTATEKLCGKWGWESEIEKGLELAEGIWELAELGKMGERDIWEGRGTGGFESVNGWGS
jgi:hypothetical protein